jgi:hypothetical protein
VPLIRLPSLDIPDGQKRAFSEADVHSTLFEPDMRALGFPARTSSQADGEYFVEQRSLAIRRLKSGHATGRYDGLYLIGNAPTVLCEIKRFEALDGSQAATKAVKQLQDYALSDDFEDPPPFLVLYCGDSSKTRFFRLKTVAEGTLLDAESYEELPEVWEWSRIKEYHLRGVFAEEVVGAERLREILIHHLDQIENDLRSQVTQAIRVVKSDGQPALIGDFGKWLVERPEARRRMQMLYERKVAEVGRDSEQQVAGEMVTQAALNYLNKVFFLSLCEDRHLPGFYRIMREFLPRSRSETSPTTAAVFLGLLRRRIRDEAGAWQPDEEHAYRALRQELAPAIQSQVIEQNSWRDLIRVGFDLASEHFPLVYREDAYDYFRPTKAILAELIYDLSTKSFKGLTSRNVGDIYETLLSSRRRQQSKLGAFYTPHGDVEYMVSKLNLNARSRVLDPCMGSGHFLDGIYERLVALYREEGLEPVQVYREVVEKQIYGGDIDSFALSLAAIRLFLLSEEAVEAKPHLFVHDMLLHSPARPQEELFRNAESVTASDPGLDRIGEIDEIEFDAVVGNPPYGARKPQYKKKVYASFVRTAGCRSEGRQRRHGRRRHLCDVLRQRHRPAARRRTPLPDHERQLPHVDDTHCVAATHSRQLQDRRDPAHRYEAFRRSELPVRGHGDHDDREVLRRRSACGERDAARRLHPGSEGFCDSCSGKGHGGSAGGVFGTYRVAVLRRRAPRCPGLREGFDSRSRRRSRQARPCDGR